MTTGLKYTNGAGRTFDFDRPGVHPSFSEAFDWELSVREMNGALASYSREPREIPVTLTFSQKADVAALMDELYEVCADDVAANREGRLSVGDWGIRCVLAKSAKSLWWLGRAPVTYELAFRSQLPYWTRESTHAMLPPSRLGIGVDYPHDYAFDYGGPRISGVVVTDSVYPCDFRLVVYGPASSPSIDIGGNSYSVDVEVPEGGRVEVDSASATVELVGKSGERTNVLDKTPDAPSGSGKYIFELFRPGSMDVSWDGGFGFDLTVLERRDERPWT